MYVLPRECYDSWLAGRRGTLAFFHAKRVSRSSRAARVAQREEIRLAVVVARPVSVAAETVSFL